MSSSISGTRCFASRWSNATFFVSGIVQPSGLLKLDERRHAVIAPPRSARASAGRSTPLLASVGSSSALRSSFSIAWRKPKYVGDSMAIVSPARATVRSASISASVQPHVMTTSSGDSAWPQREARRAISRRSRGSPFGTVYVLYSAPLTRAARARKRSSRPEDRSAASGIAQPSGISSGSAAYSSSFGMTPETVTVVARAGGLVSLGVGSEIGAPSTT